MGKYSAVGALSGAASGAAIGSAIPVIGTAAGALIGGVAGFFGSKKKKKKAPKQISTLDPQQQALYKDYISSIRGEGPMAGMYNFDAEGYNKVFDQTIGRQANRSFKENIVPTITGQFRSNGLQNSSYAGESLSRAGRDVQENLDAQRSANIFQGQQQAQQNKQNAINSVLNTQTFANQKPGSQTPSTIDQILGKVGPAAGDWFADYLKKGMTNLTTPASPTAPKV